MKRWQKPKFNLTNLALWAGVLVLGAISTIATVVVVANIHLQYPLQYNEGWNAYHASAAMAGSGLYPPAESYMTNNYPPLSFYLVGGLGKIMGNMIVAGRILSLLAFLVIAAGVYLFVRRTGTRRLVAVFAVTLFCSTLLLLSRYVGIDDPQLLAEAFAVIGGLIVVYGNRGKPAAILLAALFLALAFFTKHNVVSMALAASIYLLLKREYKNFLLLVMAGGLLFDIGLVICKLALHINLLDQLNSARIYHISKAYEDSKQLLLMFWAPILSSAVFIIYNWRKERVSDAWLYAAYGIVSFCTGIFFLGGAGINVNVMFDTFIAFTICATLGLKFVKWEVVPALIIIATCIPMILHVPKFMHDQTVIHRNMPTAQADIDLIRNSGDKALCTTLSLCYWAGEPPLVDVFNTGQQLETGQRSDRQLVSMIRSRYFTSIQIESGADIAISQFKELRAALSDSYALSHKDSLGMFYVPLK